MLFDAETRVGPYFRKKTCHYTFYKIIKLTKFTYFFDYVSTKKLLDLELGVGIRTLTQLRNILSRMCCELNGHYTCYEIIKLTKIMYNFFILCYY
jgi:hypothetical protein